MDGPALAIGFLHTAQVHVATFNALVASHVGVQTVHVVDESLLENARRDGVDRAELAARVAARLGELRTGGAGVVVCTCSTIGALAESLSGALKGSLGAQVWRVDRPAARRAVTTAGAGGRVGVVVAVDSTVGPTRALLDEEAAAIVGVPPEIEVVLADGAWDAWEAGDVTTYAALVARTATELAGRSDVVLLAQASMAPVAELLTEVDVPVLTTPATAVAQAVRELVGGTQGRGGPSGPILEVVPYDVAWPARFERVAVELRAALATVASARVEHVGSTSVPGLAAKPVLDIDVVVAGEEVEGAVAALVAAGYVHRGDLGVEGREALLAPDDDPRRHVYVCRAGGLSVRNHLAVRDVLRRRADLRDEYAAVKLALAAEPSMDIKTYIAGKTAVLQKVLSESDLTPAELRAIRELNDPGDRRQE